jgi:hypothetical protein
MEEPEILEPDIQEDENPPDNEENNEELRKAREAMKAQKEGNIKHTIYIKVRFSQYQRFCNS